VKGIGMSSDAIPIFVCTGAEASFILAFSFIILDPRRYILALVIPIIQDGKKSMLYWLYVS